MPSGVARTYQMAQDCFFWSPMKLDVQHWVDSCNQNSKRKGAPQKHRQYLTNWQPRHPVWQGYLSMMGDACFLRAVSTYYESEIDLFFGMGAWEYQIKKRRELREASLNFGSLGLDALSTGTVIREHTKSQNSFDNCLFIGIEKTSTTFFQSEGKQ